MKLETAEVSAEDRELLASLVGQDVAGQLLGLYKLVVEKAPTDRSAKSVTTEALDDKEKRGRIHQVCCRGSSFFTRHEY